MKLRFGLAVTSALTLALGGCAAGGGGTAAPEGTTMEGANVLAQGERPRNDDFTEAAEDHLSQIGEEMSPEEARPHYQAAAEAAEEAMAADPTNPLAYRLGAQAYLGLDDYQKAGELFDRAEELRPIYELETERIRELAWIDRYQAAAPLVNAGEYEAAIEVFEQANAIYQGRPEVMLTLGQVYAQTGNFDLAVDNLMAAREIIESERIEQMDSTTQASWREQGEQLPVMIAQTLVNAQRYDEAVVALRELLADEPDNISYLRTLGSTFVRMEQPDSARVIFDRILNVEGLESTEYYQIGIGLYQTEDYADAAEAFEKAADASVNDRDALEMLARSLQIAYPPREEAPQPPAGTLEKLMSTAERWLELDPNSQIALSIMAQTANRMDNQELTREVVGRIEALPLVVEGLQLQRISQGGGVVTGTIQNVSASAGQTATLEVTFYDEAGSVIGVEEAMVQLPEQGASAAFRVELEVDEYVGGYGYEITL